jgi:NUMOD4 motif
LSALSVLEPAAACCADEKWKPIPAWPHEASSCGRVRSIDRLGDDGIWRLGSPLPPQPDKRPGKGYLYYDLRDGKRRRRIPAAVAVLEAHRGLRPDGCEACHNHGIRDDNHLSEIRWDTREANLADMLEHARLRTVTDQAAVTVPLSQTAGHRGVRVLGGLSQAVVTSDDSQGTVRSPIPHISPSHSSPVNPFLHTVRTSFRTIRALGRAA